MSDLIIPSQPDFMGSLNVTHRKGSDTVRRNMAAPRKELMEFGDEGLNFMDSILSREETEDVLSMMNRADESVDYLRLPSFCTSSQMGGNDPLRRPETPPLSPLLPRPPTSPAQLSTRSLDENDENNGTDGPAINNKVGSDHNQAEQAMNIKNFNTSIAKGDSEFSGREAPNVRTSDPGTGALAKNSEARDGGDSYDPAGDFVTGDPEVAKEVAIGNNVTTGSVVMSDGETDGEEISDGVKLNEPSASATNDDKNNKSPFLNGRSGKGDDGRGDDRAAADGKYYSSQLDDMIEKMVMVEDILTMISDRSTKLGGTVKDLTTSLEFSQHEIETLKKENEAMKKRLDAVEIEDKRTQFQTNALEDKVDRLETSTKKRNLIVEGIPESEGRKEDVEKVIGNLFDQLAVGRGINFDACFRMGPYTKGRPRPIFLTFEKLSDRNLVYAKRMDLRRTADFQRVWINEDLGNISKKKRGIIRMIAKEAAIQGIDCRTGKYAIHIDNVKYDNDNLTELPMRLQPTHLKQIQVNPTTLAYQSEHAPFSNFFACQIKIGAHTFFCAEQAFQFTRAKTLNRHLAATKIYLSRDVRFIKQVGAELGTTKEWESRQFEVMYACLKRKFEQNKDLQDLLLKSGNLELVEATPDNLWGCGATLSSNVIRRGEWKGRNKHGEILMVVREEIRQRQLKKANQPPQ